MGSMNPYSMIPAATAAAGQNNNSGGKGALSSPWNGSGMSLGNASKILDPLGISGNGGMDKGAAEAFLDPLGIDSGSSGLNLFGQRGTQNANGTNGVPSVLPNLGAASMIPQMPQGGFMPLGQTNPMGGQAPGIFNQMAAQSAGQLFNPSLQAPSPIPFTSNGKGAIAGNLPAFSGGNVPMNNRMMFRGNVPTKGY